MPIEFAFKAATHKKEVRSLQAEISELRSKLAEADQTIEQYVIDHATARQEIGSKSVEVQNLQTEVLELRLELATAREEAGAKVMEIQTSPRVSTFHGSDGAYQSFSGVGAVFAIEPEEPYEEAGAKSIEVQTLQTKLSELQTLVTDSDYKRNLAYAHIILSHENGYCVPCPDEEISELVSELIATAREESESPLKEVQSLQTKVSALQTLLADHYANKSYSRAVGNHRRDLAHLRSRLTLLISSVTSPRDDHALPPEGPQELSPATKEAIAKSVRSSFSWGKRTDIPDTALSSATKKAIAESVRRSLLGGMQTDNLNMAEGTLRDQSPEDLNNANIYRFFNEEYLKVVISAMENHASYEQDKVELRADLLHVLQKMENDIVKREEEFADLD